ncbi:hypothetical protein B2A_02344 [mine drainage metagenome]|uniref:Uncharacterized protein n=1 Tax=mine drainage metagenome TaxID=410659 RepID=T1AS87_9ZZZZ
MEHYDIAFGGFDIDDEFARRLGFKKIFRLGIDIPYVDVDSKEARHGNAGTFVAYGKDKTRLLKEARNGAILSISDFFIDRKLMAIIKDLDTKLIIPISDILEASYIERSKRIYRAAHFASFAVKSGMQVYFASMAKSQLYLNSYIQLIGMAGALGMSEDYARKSIGNIGKLLE